MKKLTQAALATVMAAGSVLTFAAPAAAVGETVVTDWQGFGCRVAGRDVNMELRYEYKNQSPIRFSVYQLRWETNAPFTPARLTVSLRERNGSATPLIRAWGGTASTLHDVGSTGNTGANWETATHPISTYRGVFSRIYLNADTWCDTSTVNAPTIVIGG